MDLKTAGVGVAVVGALITSGGVGVAIYAREKDKAKRSQASAGGAEDAPAQQANPAESAVALNPPPAVKETKHEVFGVKTHYFSSHNEFHTPLDRFHDYLMFEEEKDLFAAIVTQIDNLIGLDELLSARDPIGRATIPHTAQYARNQAKRMMNMIIEFNQEKRRAPTKRKDMEQLRDDIVGIMDEIVENMHRIIATS